METKSDTVFKNLVKAEHAGVLNFKSELSGYVKQLPMKIGGMEIAETRGVRHFSEEELEKSNKSYRDYLEEKKVIETNLENLKLPFVVIHKSLFGEITKSMDLLRRYDGDEDFLIANKQSPILDELEKALSEAEEKQGNISGSILIIGIVVSVILGFIVGAAAPSGWYGFLAFIVLVTLVGVATIISIKGHYELEIMGTQVAIDCAKDNLENYLKDREEVSEDRHKFILGLFPNLETITFDHKKFYRENSEDIESLYRVEESVADLEKVRKKYLYRIKKGESEKYIPVQVTLPKPPEYVISTIERFLKNTKDDLIDRGRLCVVAEAASVGVKEIANNSFDIAPLNTKPGIVYEFEHVAVIFPETFGQMSWVQDEEMSGKAIEVASEWNSAIAFLEK